MGHRKRPPTPILLLLPAAIILDVVMCLAESFGFYISRNIDETVIIALVMSQIGLLTIWLWFGQTSLWLRLIALAATVGLWAAGLQVMFAEYASALLLLLTIVGGISAMSFLLRWLGFVVRRVPGRHIGTGEERQNDNASLQSGFQFSIWHALIATTLVAVSLGVLRALGIGERLSRVFWPILSTSLLPTPSVLAVLWLSLGERRIAWRVLLFLLVPFGTAFFFAHFELGPEAWMVYLACGLIMFFYLVAMLTVRQCGYRFVRVGRDDPTEGSIGATTEVTPAEPGGVATTNRAQKRGHSAGVAKCPLDSNPVCHW